MTSGRSSGSSDAHSAYQRAIAREENETASDRRKSAALHLDSDPPSNHEHSLEQKGESDSDLYRHHSRQQSVDGG